MENYIVINGKKTELSDEIVKSISESFLKTTGYERVSNGEHYYIVDRFCKAQTVSEMRTNRDKEHFTAGNYFTDKELADKMALKMELLFKLNKFSAEHDGDKINWKDKYPDKWYIYYDTSESKFYVGRNNFVCNALTPYFNSQEIARQALKEFKSLLEQYFKLEIS